MANERELDMVGNLITQLSSQITVLTADVHNSSSAVNERTAKIEEVLKTLTNNHIEHKESLSSLKIKLYAVSEKVEDLEKKWHFVVGIKTGILFLTGFAGSVIGYYFSYFNR